MRRSARRRPVFTFALALIAGAGAVQALHSAGSQTRGTKLGAASSTRAQAKPTVDVQSLKASEVVVFRKAGGVETVDPNAPGTFTLDKLDMALAVTGTEAEQMQFIDPAGASKVGWRLPFAFSMISPPSSLPAGAPAEVLDLEPIIDATNRLHVDPQGAGYVGRIWVGVFSRRNRAEVLDLPTPVTLLISSAVIETIDPPQVTIARTGLPSFASVTLRTATPRVPASVKVRSSLTASGEADVPVSFVLPDIRVVASPERILGFGLETSVISVQASGLANPNGFLVTLQSTAGRFEPPEPVQLDQRGFGTARLRSTVVGTARVTTASANVVNAAADVRFDWPWTLLVSALIGGVLGRVVKHASTRRRRKAGTWVRDLVLGAVAGVVATIAWTVGVYLVPALPTVLTGEAAYFTVGFVAGLAGLVLPADKSN